MKYQSRKKAILLLADGTIFYGKAVGRDGNAFGEVCFNTGMTGYQEIFTDPSYYGPTYGGLPIRILVIMVRIVKKLNQTR